MNVANEGSDVYLVDAGFEFGSGEVDLGVADEMGDVGAIDFSGISRMARITKDTKFAQPRRVPGFTLRSIDEKHAHKDNQQWPGISEDVNIEVVEQEYRPDNNERQAEQVSSL
jgi:hypothetical protein